MGKQYVCDKCGKILKNVPDYIRIMSIRHNIDREYLFCEEHFDELYKLFKEAD